MREIVCILNRFNVKEKFSFHLVSENCLFVGMRYIDTDYNGTLSQFGEFEKTRVMVLQDQHPHINAVSVNKGRTSWGDKRINFVVLNTMLFMTSVKEGIQR